MESIEDLRTFVYQLCVLLTRSPIEGRHLFYIIERKVLLPHAKVLERELKKSSLSVDSRTHNPKQSGEPKMVSVEFLEIFQSLFKTLLKYGPSFTNTLAPSERLILDSTLDVDGRLQNFENYFRRLSQRDQLVLILKNQFHWPDEAISRCLQIPPGTLNTQEWLAYRNLENWIWEGRA